MPVQSRQHIQFLDGLHAALGVHPIPGERRCDRGMQPLQLAVHTQARLIGADHRGGLDAFLYSLYAGRNSLGGSLDPGAYRGR